MADELEERGLPPLDVRSLSPEELLKTGEVYDVSVMLGDWLGCEPPITAVVCCSDYAARQARRGGSKLSQKRRTASSAQAVPGTSPIG